MQPNGSNVTRSRLADRAADRHVGVEVAIGIVGERTGGAGAFVGKERYGLRRDRPRRANTAAVSTVGSWRGRRRSRTARARDVSTWRASASITHEQEFGRHDEVFRPHLAAGGARCARRRDLLTTEYDDVRRHGGSIRRDFVPARPGAASHTSLDLTVRRDPNGSSGRVSHTRGAPKLPMKSATSDSCAVNADAREDD